MKNINKLIVALLTVTVLSGGAGVALGAGIVGTPHDLSAKGWGTTEVCKFCHTPHLAQGGTGTPLWNRTNPRSYTMYTSSTFQGSKTQGPPGPASLLCLSCHDGVVALDSYYEAGAPRTGVGTKMPATNQVGAASSLTSDHPIGFNYDTALALTPGVKLRSPASGDWADAPHTLPLYSSKMECSTCHDSHDNSNGKYLRIPNTSSALCLKCHDR